MKILLAILLSIISSMISLSDSQIFNRCTYFSSPLQLEASSTQVEFRLPGPSEGVYRSNQNCEWVIKTSEENHVIELVITYRHLEGRDIRGDCVADYLDVFDVKNGNKVFMNRFCGVDTNEVTIRSSSSEMVVQFISNGRYQYRGFQAFYQSAEKDKEDDTDLVGLLLWLLAGISFVILMVTAILILCRARKRKELERARRLVNHEPGTQDEQRLSPQSTSPPAYTPNPATVAGTGSRPAGTGGQVVTLSTRSHTPPPAYDAIDTGVTLDTDNVPPPSYETVLRESVNLESPPGNVSYS